MRRRCSGIGGSAIMRLRQGTSSSWPGSRTALAGSISELFDLDEAIWLNLEGAVAQQLWPWPEPRSHLLEGRLAHLAQGAHGHADEFSGAPGPFLRRTSFSAGAGISRCCAPVGSWRWRRGRYDEAWTYATQSLELATQTDSRKHVVRAHWLQGEILAASGRLGEAGQALAASVRLAEQIQTP